MLCIIQALVSVILCGLVIWFVCRNFFGGFLKFVVSLVLCALVLALTALVFTAIEIIGWFVFAGICFFGAWAIIKWIVGR